MSDTDTNQPVIISPQKAWQIVTEDSRAQLIDIRSSMEYLFVGHPKGAVNIAWIDEPDWVINPEFEREVRKLLLGGAYCDADNCPAVILICRSGHRSQDAGKFLISVGIHNVMSIEGGFEGELDEQHHRSSIDGWRHAGLPWEQC